MRGYTITLKNSGGDLATDFVESGEGEKFDEMAVTKAVIQMIKDLPLEAGDRIVIEEGWAE